MDELLKGKINYANHLDTQVEKIISVEQLGKVDLNTYENLPIVIKWLLIKTFEKLRQLSVHNLQLIIKNSNNNYIRWSSYNPKIHLNLGCSFIFNNPFKIIKYGRANQGLDVPSGCMNSNKCIIKLSKTLHENLKTKI